MYSDLIKLSNSVSKYVVGAEGNVSKKNSNTITIKASGCKLSDIKNNDFVEYDLNGNQLTNMNRKGSMELSFHIYLLKNYNISYVCHTHPINTLKIISSNKSSDFANKRFFPDQVVFNGEKSCLVPYASPGESLTQSIIKHLEIFINEEKFFPKLILLENHGIITCGNSVEECLVITEICEKSAEIFLSPFGINFFTEDEIQHLINDKNEIYRIKQL
jgi:L-fuculose-phosphate aldolase